MMGDNEAESAEVREVEYAYFPRRWVAQAAQERTSLKDSRNTRWFGIYLDGEELVGCAALYVVRPGRQRVKGVFIDPVWRGCGLGTRITEHLLGLCEGDEVEAYALNPSWYLARGFGEMGKNGHGVVKMRRPGKTEGE